MPKIIFGLTGGLASGKGTISQYLEKKYQAQSFRYSTIIRDVLNRLYLPQSRETMQKMSTILRESFGQDLFAKIISQDANTSTAEIVCVDGIRRPDDISHLQALPNFILIHVDAPIEIRLTRIKSRGENPDDTNKTLEQFKKDHEGEADRLIPEVIAIAQEKIDNSGTLEETFKQIDELIVKYTN